MMLVKDTKTCFACLLQYPNKYFSNQKLMVCLHIEIFVSNSRQAESKNATKAFLKWRHFSYPSSGRTSWYVSPCHYFKTELHFQTTVQHFIVITKKYYTIKIRGSFAWQIFVLQPNRKRRSVSKKVFL